MSEDGGGWYYLHENGDLIWKRFRPQADGSHLLESGGFVRMAGQYG